MQGILRLDRSSEETEFAFSWWGLVKTTSEHTPLLGSNFRIVSSGESTLFVDLRFQGPVRIDRNPHNDTFEIPDPVARAWLARTFASFNGDHKIVACTNVDPMQWIEIAYHAPRNTRVISAKNKTSL